jgi:hypothetical protein
VLVVHAKKLAELCDLHGSTVRFQSFDKIHAGTPFGPYSSHLEARFAICPTVLTDGGIGLADGLGGLARS